MAKTGSMGLISSAAISAVALILAIAAIALVFVVPAAPGAKVRDFTILMGEGETIAENEVTGLEEIVAEFHRWEPDVLVVNKGDTVKLTVKNPRSNDHSFTVESQPGDFSGTTSTGDIQGKTNSGTTTGTETMITFTANKAGVYRFSCATPQDPANNKCDPDHRRMVGYLIVLE